MFFSSIYTLFSSVVYASSTPILVMLMLLKKKYKHSIPSRFFLSNTFLELKKLGNKNDIYWFHVCSLGEANAIKVLLKKNFQSNPSREILVSVITNTGFETIKNLNNPNIKLIYLPFEPLLILMFIFLKNKKIKIKKLIVLEAELWFLLFKLAKQNKIKTALLNARISTRSFPKYMKFSFFYKRIFKFIDKIFTQTNEDFERFAKLGANKNKLENLGNIKTILDLKIDKKTILDKKILNKKIIIGASTHENEEELITSAFLKYNQKKQDSILFLIPRHVERVPQIEKNIYHKIKLSNKKYKLFSEIEFLNQNDITYQALDNDIIIIDKFGLMIEFYRISDVVILGGSFVENIGGHNPIEVVQFENKLISGSYIFNQKALFHLIENAKIISLKNSFSDKNKIDLIFNSLLETENSEISKLISLENKNFNIDYLFNKIENF